MSIYECNMQSLKLNRMHIYSCINNKTDDNKTEDNKVEEIEVAIARDGNKITSIFCDDKTHRLNSAYRPLEEAIKWAEQFNVKHERAVFMMFGLGNGYFSKALLNRMAASQYIIIYEPSRKMFEHTLNHYDITDLIENKQVYIIVDGYNNESLKPIIYNVINIYNFLSVEQCIHPNYDIIYRESCICFYKLIKQTLTSIQININTRVSHGNKSVENTFRNLRHYNNSNTIYQLKDKIPSDVPAIVVAAGPSLQDNIGWIKKAKGKSVIFAVDRVIDYLLDEGIEPDFLVTIDPVKDRKYFSRRDDLQIPLICFTNSNHEIINQHKGRKIFCTSTSNSFIYDMYRHVGKEPQTLLPSGSVAIVAYTACVELGFQRVVLVGQDLAYQGEVSHVGGGVNTKGEIANVYVEDLDGNQIKSRYDWKEFISRYEDLISIYDTTEVIDVKDRGAKINGTISMPFSQVYENYCTKEFDLEHVFKNLDPMFNGDDINQIKNYIEKHLTILNNIKEKAIKGNKLCEKQLKMIQYNNQSNNYDDTNKKIDKINRYIKEQKVYKLIDSIVVSSVNDNLMKVLSFTDDEQSNIKKTFINAKKIYEAINEAIDFTREFMLLAIKEL